VVARWRTAEDLKRRAPRHAVWEITLSCNLKCRHCGSRAGAPRSDELDTAEALALVDDLAAAGVREVTLIGGEAYLRRDWLQIVAAIHRHGILCNMQTGGRALTRDKLAAAAAAGLGGVGVSIDGPKDIHDEIRGVRGAFEHALAAVHQASDVGLAVSANSQINALTAPALDTLFEILVDAGITHWQPMLTVPMGNAVENERMLLQPHELLGVIPRLAELCRRAPEHGMVVTTSNTIGYFGPHEKHFRGLAHAERHWTGCEAAASGIGIEADGTIKGCPSLETRKYAIGKIRETAFADIWSAAEPVRQRKAAPPQGARNFCGTCYYRDTCLSGCTWQADSLTGDGRNNPFCHYRALRLDAHGLRERIAKVEDAANESFAVGRFDVLCEDRDGAPARDAVWQALVAEEAAKSAGVPPGDMLLCAACDQFFHAGHETCPHCAVPVSAAARDDQLGTLAAYRAMDLLRDRLGEIGILPADEEMASA
jgi:radical SAM protein with 4Fe4S-binding SPASM domain